VIFERLFGDGGSAAQRKARTRRTGSILDSVAEEARRMAGTLGSGDRSKMTEYLDSVREIEQRIQNAEAHGAQSLEIPDRPLGIPESFEEHTKLMFDLQVTAFQTDMTRVFSMILARELSARTYAHIGIPGQHHLISHHREDPAQMAEKARIDTNHVQMLAYFLEKMASTKDANGSLLDNSLIMYGKVKQGSHYAYKQDTPMANLLVTILDKAGVPIEKLGDSTGKLAPNPLTIG
jgi:hypothetical protein